MRVAMRKFKGNLDQLENILVKYGIRIDTIGIVRQIKQIPPQLPDIFSKIEAVREREERMDLFKQSLAKTT